MGSGAAGTAFLGVSMLTAGVWVGWLTVKDKARRARKRLPSFRLSAVMTSCGAVLLAVACLTR